ncbi:uncharacterized protein LOC115327699 [Ixodes scapularis]|uniref:uncharacterized protein LOC115327699 n=1 Tax=Ixodes scapularis TaxID=6945 RepID=UPI001A9DFFFA|nr:uncharacterized protein LOC115327699 [Ixodes scapularis]
MNAFATMDNEVALVLPSRRALLQTIRRARNAMRPAEPTCAEDVDIVSPYNQTLDGQDFLLYQGSAQGAHFLIFSTANNMKLLCDSTTALGDGTFFVTPKIYTQLYTLHGWCGLAASVQKMLPLV